MLSVQKAKLFEPKQRDLAGLLVQIGGVFGLGWVLFFFFPDRQGNCQLIKIMAPSVWVLCLSLSQESSMTETTFVSSVEVLHTLFSFLVCFVKMTR